MGRLWQTLDRYVQRQIRENRQVRVGTYKQPAGLTRGLVRIGGCDQLIEGERSSDHRKDQPVLTVSAGGRTGILPAPPGKPGPSSSILAALSGTPLAVAGWLVYRSSASGIFVSRHGTDGSWIEDFGMPNYFADPVSSYIAGPFSASGAYSDGWFTVWQTSGGDPALGGRKIWTADPTSSASASYVPPAGTRISPAHFVGIRVYWIETDFSSSGGCIKPNPCRLMSADLDLTDVTAEVSTSFAGLDALDCYWQPTSGGVNHTQAGGNISFEITIEKSDVSLYSYRVGFADVSGTPAKQEATSAATSVSNILSGAGQDLDGTFSIYGEVEEGFFIIDETDIEDQQTAWLAIEDGEAVFIPPAQDAVYIVKAAALDEYDAVTSSPTLQSSITIEAHPTIISTILQVWRVGG